MQGNDTTPENLINPETGKLVAVTALLEAGESLRKSGREGHHYVQTYYEEEDGNGNKVPTPMAALLGMSMPARATVPILGQHIAWLTNELLAPNHKLATYETLGKLLRVKDTQVKKIIKELDDGNYLVRFRDLRGRTHFIVNPRCFYRGYDVCREVIVEMYDRARRENLTTAELWDAKRQIKEMIVKTKASKRVGRVINLFP